MTFFILSLLLNLQNSIASDLSLTLEVKAALDSTLANIHLSETAPSVYPYTVAYGSCASLDPHHTISTAHDSSTDRLLWTLPEDIFTDGLLFRLFTTAEIIERSESLTINKSSLQQIRKRERDRLGKRSSIPMTIASGIDA